MDVEHGRNLAGPHLISGQDFENFKNTLTATADIWVYKCDFDMNVDNGQYIIIFYICFPCGKVDIYNFKTIFFVGGNFNRMKIL